MPTYYNERTKCIRDAKEAEIPADRGWVKVERMVIEHIDTKVRKTVVANRTTAEGIYTVVPECGFFNSKEWRQVVYVKLEPTHWVLQNSKSSVPAVRPIGQSKTVIGAEVGYWVAAAEVTLKERSVSTTWPFPVFVVEQTNAYVRGVGGRVYGLENFDMLPSKGVAKPVEDEAPEKKAVTLKHKASGVQVDAQGVVEFPNAIIATLPAADWEVQRKKEYKYVLMRANGQSVWIPCRVAPRNWNSDGSPRLATALGEKRVAQINSEGRRAWCHLSAAKDVVPVKDIANLTLLKARKLGTEQWWPVTGYVSTKDYSAVMVDRGFGVMDAISDWELSYQE